MPLLRLLRPLSLLLVPWLFFPLLRAEPAYDTHVLFGNSPTGDSYEASGGRVVAPSSLELMNGRLPVENAHFASPPNALRLKWRSASGGDWQVAIRASTKLEPNYSFKGDAVFFWVYSEQELTEANAPRVFLVDKGQHNTNDVTLVRGADRLPARQWFRVVLPLSVLSQGLYNSTSDSRFDMQLLRGLVFMQGLDDDKEHVLYVDDVQVGECRGLDLPAAPAPSGPVARGYERHVDLSWGASGSAAQILEYRIYRSTDGKEFRPVASQRALWTRYEDFPGGGGGPFHYRISAIDLDGRESPLSEAVSASLHPMTDEQLLDMVQEGCFRYYWEMGHPKAGLAPEILPGDPNLLALGGNGFGVMALLSAADRGFITHEQAVERMLRIVRFLARADRFHGVWPHFLNGDTGHVIPFFGKYDDGGDLVETAFMMQGLLAARQYFTANSPAERELRDTITRLWREVEWDWYRKTPDSPVLYWHWSPDYSFHISHPLIGWNETMIIYLLAIASPTHGVPASLYHSGWAGTSPLHLAYRHQWSRTTQGDHYVNGNTYYGLHLEVGEGSGSDLFFTHFSFMGFDPRGLRDAYANYFDNNRAISLISQAYCTANPGKYVGYGPDCWGLSAGVNGGGGRAQPRDDNGTINVMASLSSMPYTPAESMAVLRHLYRDLGDKTWGPYGFYDSFNQTENWFEPCYMALNQGPITTMIENHRSGLVWRLFMSNPEIRPMLDAIGFKPDTKTSK
jgi:hypothetical protein